MTYFWGLWLRILQAADVLVVLQIQDQQVRTPPSTSGSGSSDNSNKIESNRVDQKHVCVSSVSVKTAAWRRVSS